MINTYTFRPIEPKDQPFLVDLFLTTRIDIHQAFGLSAEQKQIFLKAQFDAQHSHYQKHYPDGEFNLILNAKKDPIGRIYTDQSDTEITVVDITLLPFHRGSGIGSSILKNIIEKARKANIAVRLHVVKDNPAFNLYSKLGFNIVKTNELNYCMEWSEKSESESVHQLENTKSA